tara:strand:- start:1707 stop:3206 length:1500 start_codon:yes stop_codon:yes gene_type:complete
MTRTTKKEKLEYSRAFDIHKWSEHKEVKECVDSISKELMKLQSCKTSRENLIKKHLKVLIVDLWSAWNQDPKLYIGISRRMADYKINKRYGKLKFGYKSMVKVLDGLEKKKYIEQHIGWLDRNRGIGRNTKIIATKKLIQKIVKEHKIKKSHIQKVRNQECLILKDKIDGKNVEIDYKDNKNTKRMRNDLIEYNNLLRRTHIYIPNYSSPDIKVNFEDESSKFVRRIFNNKSWKNGGRFYSGWWQRVRSHDRKYIRINNNPVVEIDFSGLHIVILYSMVKIDYWNKIGKDPYDLSGYGYDMDDCMRSFLKTILLISINEKKGKKKDTTRVVKAVRDQVRTNEDFSWIKDTFDIEKIINDFADYHNPIKKYFYSGLGLDLQYIDSQIASLLINHFTRLDIPVLSVHDSFVIEWNKDKLGDEEDSLDWMMEIFYNKVIVDNFKTSTRPKLKIVGGIDYFIKHNFQKLKEVRKDKKYIASWKKHQKQTWFENYYHDQDIKYS